MLAPVVLVLSSLAARSAFVAADNTPRQTDRARLLSRAGMALVALALTEALIAVIAGFVWALSRNG